MPKLQSIGKSLLISIPKDLVAIEGLKKGDKLLFSRPSRGKLELVKF